MKKVFLSIIGILFLSCSFYDETKALSFHSDCYLAFKGWLKEGGSDSASAPEREGIRNGMAAWLPVAAAMIVSALIVALTLVVLFY